MYGLAVARKQLADFTQQYNETEAEYTRLKSMIVKVKDKLERLQKRREAARAMVMSYDDQTGDSPLHSKNSEKTPKSFQKRVPPPIRPNLTVKPSVLSPSYTSYKVPDPPPRRARPTSPNGRSTHTTTGSESGGQPPLNGSHTMSQSSMGDRKGGRMERTRENVCKEIVSSEKAYVESLLNLVDHFVKPMRKRGPLKLDEVNLLFSNIEDILSFHQVLLSQLQDCDQQDIYMPFRNIGGITNLYTEYVNGYSRAIEVCHRHENSSRFQKFLQSAVKASRSSLGLMAYLIMPVQRIPRYALLLKEVIKNTSRRNVEVRTSLQKSLNKVEKVATEINERKRMVDNKLSIMAIQAKLGKSLNSSPLKGVELLEDHRWFIHEGRLRELKLNSLHVKERVVVVFSDLILWATFPQYKYKGHRSLVSARIKRVQYEDPKNRDRMTFAFEITNGLKDTDPTVFLCSSTKMANTWISRLKNTRVQTDSKHIVSPTMANVPQVFKVEEDTSSKINFDDSSSSRFESQSSTISDRMTHHARIRSIWGGTQQLGLMSASIITEITEKTAGTGSSTANFRTQPKSHSRGLRTPPPASSYTHGPPPMPKARTPPLNFLSHFKAPSRKPRKER